VLWPLFHYVPLPLEARLAETKNLQNQWTAYVQTNHLYRESVMELYEDGDVVWAHDYHVLLLPKLLKEVKPGKGLFEGRERVV
jgi:trehalose 6-phosphate synthase/phosphatase